MDFELSEDHRLFMEAARTFAKRAVEPGAAERDKHETFPDDVVRKLGENGFLGVKVSEDYGGSGADNASYILALREIARVDAATAVAMAVTNMVADAIEMFGSESQKQKYLVPMLAGEAGTGSFCLSEPEAGSDATAIRCAAVQDGAEFVLNGTKSWVSNGSHSDISIVFATLDRSLGSKGVTAFLVEKGTPGFAFARVEDKMGLRGSETAVLTFDDVKLGPEQVLGELGGGMKIALGVLDGGRIGISTQAVGVGEAALAEGRNYAKDRKAFGQPIGDFQALQWMLADTVTELDAAWLLTLRAASLRDQGLRVTKEASMAKVFSTEACGRAVDRMLQIHGGYGYTKEYLIERLYRDARVFRIYEGTSEVQRIVIARQILKDQ